MSTAIISVASPLKGCRALVTGASSGIGEQLARRLAARGAHLVLTARREQRLEKLADELRAAHKIEVLVVASDLASEGAAQKLLAACDSAGWEIDVLVNNAGFGNHDNFADLPWETTHKQLTLNMTVLTELCWRFLGPMKQRKRGWILNVASVGAYMPVPGYATYVATKAYVRNFSEGIAAELSGSGVSVTCLCPGATRTEFMDVAGHEVKGWQEMAFRNADECAEVGIKAMEARKPLVVDGIMNKLTVFSMRMMPRRLMTWVAGKVMA